MSVPSTIDVPSAFNALAWAIALVLCWKIYADGKRGSTMRLSWFLMTLACGFSVLRHVFQFSFHLVGWDTTYPTTWVSLRQIPIMLALVCLTAGLLAMHRAFTAVGLSGRLRSFDLAWAAGVLLFIPLIFAERENMADSHSAWPAIRALQLASPLLLAAPALAGIALHRISLEMGEGQLALSLRFLVASLIVRLVALWMSNQSAFTDAGWIHNVGQMLFWAAHWIFLLGVWYRWRLTASARTMTARYGADPKAEVEDLVRLARL
ncbi:MAG: hypothetical protein H7039_05695 [Bryobacteraceae bacterium]|nr:hypothetical protein [Bryobacteraceae bacterium]